MWCVGNCNIPHARQDTNSAMDHSIVTLSEFFLFHKKNLQGIKWNNSFTTQSMISLLTTNMVCCARSLVTSGAKNVKELLLMLCFGLMTSHPPMFCYTQMGLTLLSWHLAIIHPRFGSCMPRIPNGPNVTAHLQHEELFASML